jgi:hypothetical protein
VKTRAGDAFARYVSEIEQVVMLLLCGQRRRLVFRRQERFARLGVSLLRGKGDEFLFGITQRGEFPAKDATATLKKDEAA